MKRKLCWTGNNPAATKQKTSEMPPTGLLGQCKEDRAETRCSNHPTPDLSLTLRPTGWEDRQLKTKRQNIQRPLTIWKIFCVRCGLEDSYDADWPHLLCHRLFSRNQATKGIFAFNVLYQCRVRLADSGRQALPMTNAVERRFVSNK